MSTPEHTPATAHTGQSATEVEARRAADLAIYTHATNPTRTTQAVSWVGWHVGELAGLVVPLGLGATVWDGFYVASALTALGWVAHELRLRRQQRAIRIRTTEDDRTDATGRDGEVSA